MLTRRPPPHSVLTGTCRRAHQTPDWCAQPHIGLKKTRPHPLIRKVSVHRYPLPQGLREEARKWAGARLSLGGLFCLLGALGPVRCSSQWETRDSTPERE